jgi:hypothetical protein
MYDVEELERENRQKDDLIRAFAAATLVKRPPNVWMVALTLIVVACTAIQLFVVVPQVNGTVDRVQEAREQDAQRAKATEAMRNRELLDLADIAVEISRLKRQLKGKP